MVAVTNNIELNWWKDEVNILAPLKIVSIPNKICKNITNPKMIIEFFKK